MELLHSRRFTRITAESEASILCANSREEDMGKLNYSTTVRTLDGDEISMREYRGKVLLVVNTASGCVLTPQFDGLEKLWGDYGPRGLVVLGFPCNQFGGQDPASNREIGQFCRVNYGVTFPMHAKIEVNGPHTHPLFEQLKKHAPGIMGSTKIKWNFTKFLVGSDGGILKRFAPATSPDELRAEIEIALDGRAEAAAADQGHA
jgi:glutathione peroxidase